MGQESLQDLPKESEAQMIQINFEEHCPFCHEEVEMDCDDGSTDETYECDCGASMEMSASAKVTMEWSAP